MKQRIKLNSEYMRLKRFERYKKMIEEDEISSKIREIFNSKISVITIDGNSRILPDFYHYDKVNQEISFFLDNGILRFKINKIDKEQNKFVIHSENNKIVVWTR